MNAACCMKCKNDTENIDPKIFRAKNSSFIMNQNVMFAELKSQDL